jgi:hypothetical protein
MTRKKTTTQTSTKNPRTGEALRKEALADADRNLAAIEAQEHAPGETPVKPAAKERKRRPDASPLRR